MTPAVGNVRFVPKANSCTAANSAADNGLTIGTSALLASVPVILVVNPDSDVGSVADLIALAKSKPDQVLHATVIGSLPHLASELFARAGIRWTQVPFQGSPQTSLWFGLLGPAGTPRPIIDKLADAAPKAMQTPKAQEALRKQGFEALNGGPDEFAQYIRRETARWTDVAQTAGLRS